jgi:hypothetical protein
MNLLSGLLQGGSGPNDPDSVPAGKITSHPHPRLHHAAHRAGNGTRAFARPSVVAQASVAAPAANLLLRLVPHARVVELALLALTLQACVVMWAVARRTQASEERSGLLADDAVDPRLHERNYRQLRNIYLSVYAFATFGDWIQGGFLYALYAEYGYSMRDIGLIFVVGYASAMFLGTYVSALGDSGGHRRNCIAYGFLYATSCLLCNYSSVALLLLGRVVGGVAYSILYTSFESWLIAEADARHLPRSSLSRLFSLATFTNAASAVVAGMVGHLAVEVVPHTTHNRFASAFDVGVVVLLLVSVLAAVLWGERYGDRLGNASDSLWRSCRAIRDSRSLLALGMINSLYEAALYVFVFLWTPALESRSGSAGMGHGLVFSIFMTSKSQCSPSPQPQPVAPTCRHRLSPPPLTPSSRPPEDASSPLSDARSTLVLSSGRLAGVPPALALHLAPHVPATRLCGCVDGDGRAPAHRLVRPHPARVLHIRAPPRHLLAFDRPPPLLRSRRRPACVDHGCLPRAAQLPCDHGAAARGGAR